MIERIAKNKLIVAVLSIAFGIYLIIARSHAVDSIIRIGGWVSLVTAAAYLLFYFFGPARDEVQLGYAVLAGVMGLLAIWLAPAITNIGPILLGVALIIAGLSNLTAAREVEIPVIGKIFPVLIMIAGLLVVFYPRTTLNVVMVIAGIGMIVNGVTELDLVRRIRNN